MFDLENLGQGHENNIGNHAIRRRISISVNVVRRIFAPLHTVSEILTFQIYDLENLGQGHGIQYSQ